MNITITAKIQIYPTEDDIILISDTISQITKALNHISDYVYKYKEFNQSKINKDLYYELRDKFKLKSQMAQSCMKTVIAKYKSAKNNGHDFTLIDFKNPEYDLVWNRDYSLTKDIFSLNTLQGRIKVPYEIKGMEQYFKPDYTFGTAKLVFKFNKFFLHIPVTKDFKEPNFKTIDKIVGIDLGINFLATTYDSYGKTKFFNGREIKSYRGHLKDLRKQLQILKTHSSRAKIKSIGSRENRFVSDVNHRIAKALVEQYGNNTLFVLEDLSSVRKATEKVRVKDRYVSVSWAYYQFAQLLEYKAKMNGSIVIKVDARYTSQQCPFCGHIEKSNRNKRTHTFKCKSCIYTSNDDRIGAMNLWRKGLNHLEQLSKEDLGVNS